MPVDGLVDGSIQETLAAHGDGTGASLAKASNLSDVADAGSSRFNLASAVLSAVAAVSVANLSIAAPGATLDGYTILTGDEILLTAQTTASQNGVWLWNGSASALTRPNEFPTGGVVKRGRSLTVINGTVYANTVWVLNSTSVGITIDTTSQVWTQQLPRAMNNRGPVAINTVYNPWDVVIVNQTAHPPGARVLITSTVTSSGTGFISSTDYIELTSGSVWYASDYNVVGGDAGGTDYSVPFNALQLEIAAAGGGLCVMPPGRVFGSSPFVLQDTVYTTFNGGWNSSGFALLPGSNCDVVQTSIRVGSTPAAWVSGTNYGQTTLVSYSGKFYFCLFTITNNSTLTPDIDNGNWSWVNCPVGSIDAIYFGLSDCMITGDSSSSQSHTAFNNGFSNLSSFTQQTGDIDFDYQGRVRNVFVKIVTGHGFISRARGETVFDGCFVESVGGTAFLTCFDTEMVNCKAEGFGLGGFADLGHADIKWTGNNAYNGGTVPQFLSLFVSGGTTSWVLSSQNGVGNGTFTITVPAGTTSAIAWNATAATIASAVSAVAGFSGTCTGAGGPVSTNAVTLTFSASQATLTVVQTQTWTVPTSYPPSGAMYLGSLYKAKSTLTNYSGVPSTDTANWQLIYAAPEWGIPYCVIGSTGINVLMASCGSNANPSHGLLLRNCVGVNVQANLTEWNCTPGNVNNPTNPNQYAGVVLDNCTGCIVTALCGAGVSSTGYGLAILNGASKNILNLTSDGNITTFLTPSSTPIAGSGNSVVYDGVSQSPAAVGAPTAPTAAALTSNTQLATTAYADSAVLAATSGLAPLASPALTGTPSAPTAPGGTNTTQLATTAFVLANVTGIAQLLTQINASTSGAIAAALGDIVNTTAAATVTLPASPTIGKCVLVNRGNHTALITITANTGQTINGGASAGSVTMAASTAISKVGQALFVAQSSTAWSVIALGTDLGQGYAVGGSMNVAAASSFASALGVSGTLNLFSNVTFHNTAHTTTTNTNQFGDLWVRATSGSWTLTLTAGTTNQIILATNEGTGTIAVVSSSGVVNGVTSLPPGGSAIYLNNGTNWDTVADFGCVLTQLAPTTVAGTAGNLVCSQPFIGSGYKKALVIVGATFVSVGGVTYTFPVAFSSTPVVTSGAVAGTTVTVSTTGVTVVAASALGALAGITVEGT